MTTNRTPHVILDTPVSEAHSQFNPNGPPRWIAYSSDDTGRREIYVAPFVPGQPASGERRQVSSEGGTMPRWRRDGRELYYWALDGRLMAVPVDGSGAAFLASPPLSLFQSHRPTMRTNDIEFDVTRDGLRFLMVEPSEATTFQSLSFVTDWRRR
jgi:Tol biopolymer transport system component